MSLGATPRRTPPRPAPRSGAASAGSCRAWCGPCRAELPLILDYGRTGAVDLIALSVDDEFSAVQQYFGDAMPAELAWDAKIVVEPALGVRSLPTTFLIDTDGRVVRQLIGAQDWSDPTLRRSIQQDLQKR